MRLKLLFFYIFIIYTPLFASHVQLTFKEKKFLKENPTIILGTDSNWSPYVIKNNDGTIDGYDSDILNLINQKTGANFQLVAKNWKDVLEDAKLKKIDGLSTSAYHKEREKYFNFSDIYISSQRILIVSNLNPKNIQSINDLKGKKIAYQQSNLSEKKLVSVYNESIAIPYNTYEDIIRALINGEVDAVLGNYAMIYFAIKKNLPYIKAIDTIPNSTLKLVFSVRKDFPEAVSILNKGLRAISNADKLTLQNKWFYNLPQKNKQISLDKKLENILTHEEKIYLKSHPTLKVQGISTFPPFNFLQNGDTIGYTVDYMELMGKYLGIEFEFVKNKTFPETIAMFKKGEIDILPHIAKNKTREEFIDFTDFNHIIYPIGVAIRKDLKVTSFNQLKDKTIAVIEKAFTSSYIKKHYPNQKLIKVKSSNDGVLAVANEKADIFIGNIPTINFYIKKNWLNNVKTIQIDDLGLPQKVSLPMGVQKGNATLKSILEKTNKIIGFNEIQNLQERWLSATDQKIDTINLTNLEKEYLSNKKKINICVLPNWLPFEQIDKDGKHKGIGHEILDIISEKIDKKFILVPTKEWSQSLQNIRDRKCDILPVAMDVPNRRDAMNFTKPYVDEPFIIATTSDKFFIKDERDLSYKKIGVVKSYAFSEVLKEKNPLIEIIEVKDTKEGLEKVNNGELFGYIDTLPTIGYFIQKYGYFDLKVAGKLPYNITLSIASRNDEPLLNSIMQKALDTISEDEIRKIVGKWIEIKVHQEFDYTILFYVVAFFSIVLLLIIYKNKKINEQKNELRQLIESSSDGVFIMDLNGNLIDCSNKACLMLGYTKEEMLQLNVTQWETLYSKEEIKELFNKLTKETSVLQSKHKRKDGTFYDTEIYVNKITLGQKELLYSSVRDITKEKKLQEKILEQKEELETIFDYSKDGIAIIDLESNLLKVNHALVELTGYKQKELLHKSCIELSSPEDKQKLIDALSQAVHYGYLENFEQTYLLKNDKRVHVNLSLSLLPDKKSFIMLTKDMTNLKIVESQSRLASMGQMIGNIAHQWRQPLSVITTSASAIQLQMEFNTLDKENLKDFSDTIVKQAKYLSTTIDNFKNFIKDEKLFKEISIKNIIESTLSLTSASLKNNYITLVLDINTDKKIYGNKNELIEAFINIINNAKDGLRSNIQSEDDRFLFITTKELKEKNAIELLIKDTAGGIDNKIINRIFEPYFTTKHQSQGTGLGLSIVDKVIRERHHATINVYNDRFSYNNKEYSGACFSIIFESLSE